MIPTSVLMTSGMLAPKNCLIGKTVATSKVLFIAPICLRSHFGDRPFLAGMAVTSRGAGGLVVAVCGSGVIGKSIATVKVFFIARIGLNSHFGDRPFLAGMAVTSRGVLLMGWSWRFAEAV
jgi:hypothetical protein